MKKKNFFRKNIQFTVLLVLVAIIVLIAIFANFIAPCDPYEAVLSSALRGPGFEGHILGTDKLGRDIFSRVIFGTRITLSSAIILLVIIFVIGTILGILAGYFGGWVDAVIMRIADMMISFPGMVLAIAVAGILGASIVNAVIALAIVSWTKYARLARSLVLKIKNCDYIEAAKVTGSKTTHIIKTYLVPNVIPTLVITAATDLGAMILELAGLSFLGFGAQSPMAEWGLMLSEGKPYMSSLPVLMLAPGIAILIVVIIFNLLGDSIRDILDPRMSSSK